MQTATEIFEDPRTLEIINGGLELAVPAVHR